MGNLLEQAEVPLAGRGFFYRPAGSYMPGEYRRLVNVEVDLDGRLVSRRPATAVQTIAGAEITWPQPQGVKFIGNLNEWAMYVSNDRPARPWCTVREVPSYSIAPDTRVALWNGPATTTAHFADLANTRIVGFHRYNDRNYWVSKVFRATVAGAPMTALIQVLGYALATDNGNSADPAYFDAPGGAIPTQRVTVATTAIASTTDPTIHQLRAETEVVKTLMFRDRMWIATERTLYFSKATDPNIWAVPDGGFFRFPNQTITDVVAVGQALYIICEDSIWLLQYTTDPNTNANLAQISVGLGGDSATVYEDVVYFSRNDILYSCDNNRVNKVMDLGHNAASDIGATGYALRLHTWNNYIIFNYQAWAYQDVSGPAAVGFLQKSYPIPLNYDQGYIPIIWLNMQNGAQHQFDFKDQTAANSDLNSGRPVDFLPVPFKDSGDRTILYFHTGGNTLGGGLNSKGYAYYIPWDNDWFAFSGAWYDATSTSADAVLTMSPTVDIEIDSYSPDDSEFTVKKFRSCLLEMDIAHSAATVRFGFGDIATLGPIWDLPPYDGNPPGTAMNGNQRPPYPYRLPMNQKARVVTVKIMAEQATATGARRFFIKRLVFLWTPTGRLPAGKRPE